MNRYGRVVSVVLLSALLGARGAHADVVGFGANFHGQLGNGSTANNATPQTVTGVSNATAVAAGALFSAALLSDGTVRTWGRNSYGELGDGTKSERHTPVAVVGLTGVTAIAAGGYHMLALLNDGTVMAWGRNSAGQLGNGTKHPSTTPIPVPGLSGVVAIAAGLQHSVALLNDGTVRAWGSNIWWHLGDGTHIARLSPVVVSGLSNVTAIAAGSGHTLALLSDGTVRAWGADYLGQLGDSGPHHLVQSRPVPVAGLSGVVSISAGYAFSLAARNDGTVWAWGDNRFGQIGDGSKAKSRPAPTQAIGISNAIAVSAGAFHSEAQLSDGTLMSWGYNYWGQLGDGTRTKRTAPVAVPGLSGVTAVSAGTASHGGEQTLAVN